MPERLSLSTFQRRRVGLKYLIVAALIIAVSAVVPPAPAWAQGQATNVCPPGPTSPPGNVNGTLLGSQNVGGGQSNSDAERLAFVQQVTGPNQVVQVQCDFTPQNALSGTWSSSEGVTHILVKASTMQQVYEVAGGPKTSGDWSTQCIRNPGKQQPAISGLFCYRVGGEQGKGIINITKKVLGGTGQFDFTLTGPTPQNFSLTPPADGEQTQGFGAQDPGNYTIAENIPPPPAGFSLSSISCTSSNGGAIDTDLDAGTASFHLEEGETINCTYTNTKQPEDDQGTIKVVKLTTGGDDAFDFTIDGTALQIVTTNGQGQTNPIILDEGTYSVVEDETPGWTFTGASCVNQDQEPQGSLSGTAITGIELGEGEDIVCTFTNTRTSGGDPPMEEETKRFIHRRVDNLLTHGPDRARLLRRLQEQAPDLKGGPLKLSGEPGASSTSPGANRLMAAGGSLQTDAVAFRGTSVAETGVPWVDAVMGRREEEPFGMTPAATAGPTSTSSSLLSGIAGQLMPLMNGETSFKFGTSLSEIRANAVEAEARSQQKKLQEAGLSFGGQPYTNPFLGVRQGLDFWVEGHITRYHDDIGGINREGDFRILYVGADYVLDDGVLVGALVQVDDTSEDIDDPTRTGEIDGTGWMVGPYFGARVLDNLCFDARAAWGQSDNDIWIDDAAGPKTSGSFDTERWLATATLTGVHYHGAWRLSPQVGLAYGHESYDTYVNSIGQTVAGGEANIGRLTGGTEVAYRLQTWDGTIVEPMLGITGIWNFDSDDLVINGVVQETDDNRAKLEGGVMIRTPDGWALRAAGMYDGIGGDDFEAYGGSLWVNVPLDRSP